MSDVNLDLPDSQPKVSDDAKILLSQLRRDPPGQATDNRLVQSFKDTGIPYLAITAIANALAGSTVRVKLRNDSPDIQVVAKSATQANAHQRDHELVDAPRDHPLCKLFTRLNPNDTFEDVMTDIVLQYCLTGTAPIWLVPSKLGPPCELYVLKTGLMLAGPASPEYPGGTWRYQQYYPAGPYGMMPSPASGMGILIDARQVKRFRLRHPLWSWDGYSPLTAGGVQLDVLNAIDESRKSAMDHGFNPDAIATVAGASSDSLARVRADFENKHGGARNARKIAFTNGTGIDIKPLSTNPKEMDYGSGWDQMVKYALALFGVPPGTAGIAEATSYAQLYASLRQFYSLKMQPLAKALGSFLTKHLAETVDPDAVIQIDVPDIDDKEFEQKKWDSAAQNGFVSANEYRGAVLSLPPQDGGDSIPAIEQQKQAEMAQQQQDQQSQQQAQEPQTPDDAVAHGVLGMLGVDPNGDDQQEQPQEGQPDVQKAMPGKFDENKHKRDHGKFSSTGGASAVAKPVGTRATVTSSTPGNVKPPAPKPQVAKFAEHHSRQNKDLEDIMGMPTVASRMAPVPGLIEHFGKIGNNYVDASQWVQQIKFPQQAVTQVKEAIAKTGQDAEHLLQSNQWAVAAAKKYSGLVGKKLGKDPAKCERALFHMFVKMAQMAKGSNGQGVNSKVSGVGNFKLKPKQQQQESFKGRGNLDALFKSAPELVEIFKGL